MRLITIGATRIVLLTDQYAIKFARLLRIGYCVKRVVRAICNNETAKFVEWKEYGLLKKVLFTPVFGIIANILEYRRSKYHRQWKLVPTRFTCFALFNIQQRGEPVTAGETLDHPVVLAVRDLGLHADLGPEQFCRIGGEVLLADYGHYALGFLLNAPSSTKLVFVH